MCASCWTESGQVASWADESIDLIALAATLSSSSRSSTSSSPSSASSRFQASAQPLDASRVQDVVEVSVGSCSRCAVPLRVLSFGGACCSSSTAFVCSKDTSSRQSHLRSATTVAAEAVDERTCRLWSAPTSRSSLSPCTERARSDS